MVEEDLKINSFKNAAFIGQVVEAAAVSEPPQLSESWPSVWTWKNTTFSSEKGENNVIVQKSSNFFPKSGRRDSPWLNHTAIVFIHLRYLLC